MLLPYIGITDFTAREQVRNMLRVFLRGSPIWSRHHLHVGVMMSYKTLHGLETRFAKAFPRKEDIADIFSDPVPFRMNCLHYADYETRPNIAEDLVRAIHYGGIGIHALQLDMIWPDPKQVARAVRTSRKQLGVILQIGAKAMEYAGDNPVTVVERLRAYEGVIERVLLDKSMGRGLGMDAAALALYARAIRKSFPDLGIAVAGGLGPDTLNLVEPLVKEFPGLSIDAQGRLRPSGSALDPIDWNMAEHYLVAALDMFGSNILV